jgi:hypothetical protein
MDGDIAAGLFYGLLAIFIYDYIIRGIINSFILLRCFLGERYVRRTTCVKKEEANQD